MTFLLIFLWFFVIFSWDFWWKFFFQENVIAAYNRALSLAQNWDFSWAIDILPKEPLPKNDFYRLELYGDLEYKNSSATGTALFWYYQAKNLSSNENLEKKISFLEWEKISENIKNQEQNFSKNPQENFKKSEEIQKKEEELERIQSERKDFLNPYRTQELHLQDEISHFKTLISENNFSAQKDW